MSTKTTIKRIALVAVAALGLGMLSVVPSTAVVSNLTVTSADGTSTNSGEGYVSDSTTAATVTISALLDAANDSVTVTFIEKSRPTGGTQSVFAYWVDSTTPNGVTQVDSSTSGVVTSAFQAGQVKILGGSDTTAGRSIAVDGTAIYRITGSGAGYVGSKFALQLDSTSARIAGTYTYTAIVKSYSHGSNIAVPTATITKDISIVVPKTAAVAAASNGTIDPSKTTAIMNAGDPATLSSVDSSVVVVATASATNHATIQVKTMTSASLAAPESVTATLTGAGAVCNEGGTICGNNLTIAGDGDDKFRVRANGTAGTASIVIKTTTKTFPAKTVTFYAAAPATITVATNKPVISVAAASAQTDVVRAVAKDANGNNWAGQLYIAADAAADALIAGNVPSATSAAVTCTYNSTYGFHACPLKGTAKGTAKVKVFDASKDDDGTILLTDAAVVSATTSVRVSTGSPSTIKMMFNKSTYAPGEKALLWVKVLDEDGLELPATSISNAFAAALASNVALGTPAPSPSFGTSLSIEGATDADSDKYAGAQTYVVYMPQATGTVTVSGTGSTGVAAAGRVAVSASAEVVNESVNAAVDAANEATDAANAATDAANAAAEAADAATAAAQDAQAAVAALATQVASLIAGIKAQITSLTNLVIKIQKKVKA